LVIRQARYASLAKKLKIDRERGSNLPVNRIDKAIAEANGAVDRVTTRVVDGDPLRDAAWDQLGWKAQKACQREIRRQNREAFCKWLMVVAACVIVIVLALVWSNQLP
jgi:t-SNARE complex subunit (syntaxin)